MKKVLIACCKLFMHSKAVLILILSSMILTACFAPINSTFDSAKTLDKGEVSIQGSYSKYYGYAFPDKYDNLNNNYGFGIGYGITEQFDMKFRYERLNTKAVIELFDEELNLIDGLNYFELGGKIQLQEDKKALSIPIGIYLYEVAPNVGGSLIILDPRFFITVRERNDKIETNIIPKVHILIGDGRTSYVPGINLGFGFSSNLDEWAIRPEIGYDGNFTFGVGANFTFNLAKRANEN